MSLITKNLLLLIAVVITSSSLLARDQIKVVGSSTVYPFSTIISENFSSKNPNFKTPVVESIGTGGGFKAFCHDNSINSPDMVNASRPIKASEVQVCNQNGIKDIIEIILGYDAISIIQPKSISQVSLTRENIFLALAAKVPSATGTLIDNPYKKWSDIDKSLPNLPIKVMGPPSSSGTRDSFVELVMEHSCKILHKEGKIKIEEKDISLVCKNIRNDGPYISGGENDVLLIQKVAASTDTFAILGYSYYKQNERIVSSILIDGVAPNNQSFSSKQYPLFRPLFVYVKGDNIGVINGLNEFIKETISKEAIGSNGYLKRSGLIPISDSEYKQMISKIKLS